LDACAWLSKLAIIADIHGNVAALEAVLADIAARKVTSVVSRRLPVGSAVAPRKHGLLKRLRLPIVRGNHDRWLADVERSGLAASDAFAFDRLTGRNCRARRPAAPPAARARDRRRAW